MARRKVIITVAQTGAFHGKEANPNIPLTPEEIAASAYDCYNAGAAIIHIHARDQEGLSTNDPKVYSAIGSGIRARCNAILQYSTAPANREGTCAEDGMRLLYDPNLVKPEMCSLDCSLIGTSWGDRTFVYEWYRPFLLKYARKMRDMGIKPELECFNPESVEDVFNVLVPAGVLEEPVTLKVENGRIVDISGGRQAKMLADNLASKNDPNVYNIAEHGVGLNPKCHFCGFMLEDEGVFGSCHIGIGTSITLGGTVKAACHYDVIMKNGTIVADGKTLMENGVPKV